MNREELNGIEAPNPTEQIRRVLERLAFQVHRTAKSPNPDAVHDLRVAIRRADQALVCFKDYFRRKAAKRIRKQLKRVLASAGKLRDYDIAENVLSRTKQPGSGELQREFRAKREAAARSLLLVVKGLSLPRRVRRWCEDLALDSHRANFAPEVLRTNAVKALPRLARRFLEAGKAAILDRSGERLHDFRITAKKFRYSLEAFLPVLGSAAAEWIREIKPIQAILGAMNDYRSVLTLAIEAGCPKKLQQALRRSELRRMRQFREEWTRRFLGRPLAKWMRISGRESQRIVRKPITGVAAAGHAAAAVAS